MLVLGERNQGLTRDEGGQAAPYASGKICELP